MNKANLIGIHEAGVAHHVAPVSQVNRQYCAAAILDRARSMVVKLFVAVRVDVAAGKHLFDMRKKLDVDGHHVFEMPVNRTILYHPDLAITFNDLGLDLTNFFIDENANVLLAANN
jgi:hypothetical protein